MAEAQRRDRLFGALEAEVMRVVWAMELPVTVREVLDEINAGRRNPLAYTTVMTVMSRLVDKGALSRRREGRGYRYEAVASDVAAMAVRNVMRQFGEAAVAHFVEQVRDDPDALRRLERLLKERDDDGGTDGGAGPRGEG
ncbi:MAG TPA: BlaI/MecI/CopY family transcriptional regulator [Solirubrobacteraceae bacterium]|nr:BlaI/MecI/CopY family transcriptional regulator [Solirubrobacteraceae bacterium]